MRNGRSRANKPTKVIICDNDDDLPRMTMAADNARADILEDANGKLGVSGIIACPLCKSGLSYTVQRDGRVWASCDKKGCLKWIE